MKAFSTFSGIGFRGIYGKSWKRFFLDIWGEINEDNVFNGAAALGFYLTLAIFPAVIFLLSLLPYLPIANLRETIMGLLDQLLPGDTAKMFSGTVNEIVGQERGGLLSFGALFTLFAATNGMYAIMQQLNITYDVRDGRNFFRVRLIAAALTFTFGLLLVLSFSLILGGEALGKFLAENLGLGNTFLVLFDVLRWAVIASALSFALALVYYFGPDVRQSFEFITPGSVMGTVLLVAASLGFKFYVENFGNYNATYGSIGTVIVLMLWLQIAGLVILLGSEVNALVEHYSPNGKKKGEKEEGEKSAPGKTGKVLHPFPEKSQPAKSGRTTA